MSSSILKVRQQQLKASRRFMGAVEIPLASTLPSATSAGGLSVEAAGGARWYRLARRQGADTVQVTVEPL